MNLTKNISGFFSAGKKRKAIVKGNSAAGFVAPLPEEESYLGVRLLSKHWLFSQKLSIQIFVTFDQLSETIVYFTNLGKEKQRTLSPKTSPNCSPKRRKNKYKDDLSVSKGNSEAFTKTRERKRFESVADDMEEGAEVLSSTSNLERELNRVKVYL